MRAPAKFAPVRRSIARPGRQADGSGNSEELLQLPQRKGYRAAPPDGHRPQPVSGSLFAIRRRINGRGHPKAERTVERGKRPGDAKLAERGLRAPESGSQFLEELRRSQRSLQRHGNGW